MGKIASGDFEQEEQVKKESELDPKVVAAYRKLGVVLKSYRSGKLPKAFKIIPMTSNWEELLFLTKPEQWSRHSVYEATKIFASSVNAKMA